MRVIKIFFVFTFLLLCFNVGLANANDNNSDRLRRGKDINVYGHVVDKTTGEHLPYAVVQLKGTTIGVSTDASGHYILKNLPAGKHTLIVSAIGYFNAEKTISLQNNKSYEVNFELTEDRLSINETVVTANREATMRVKAPVIVNVLNSKLLNITASNNLAQGLVFQPGVRVEDNCQNCGFSQVRINGLDGHYSQILINSRPIFSALNGVYGLEQIPSNMIDRIEVVRGGGSALYGSSAIGGTINIITKEPTRNSAEFSQIGTAIYSFKNLASNTNLSASVVSDDNNAGLYVYGSHSYRPNVDLNGDSYSEMPLLKNYTIGGRSFFKIDTQSKITAEFHAINEYRRGGNKLDMPDHEANIAEQLQHNIVGGAVNYNFLSYDGHHKLNAYVSFQNTERQSYYGGAGALNYGKDKMLVNSINDPNSIDDIIAALDAYGKTKEFVLTTGAQYTYSFDNFLFLPANLTVGGEYLFDDMMDKSFRHNITTKQTLNNFSFYAQNEWVNDKYSLLLGVRVDKHAVLKKPIVSPRFTLRYRPFDFINLRASYASGFRAPQLFDEDLHTDLADGKQIKIKNSRNLKAEHSHSFNLSADTYFTFGRFSLNFLVDAFYTRLTDAFDLHEPVEGENGFKIRERYNAGTANIYGANLEAKLAFDKWIQVQGGFTLQRSLYGKAVENEGLPARKRFLRTPNYYGYFTSTIKPFNHFSIDINGTYTGSMLIVKNAIDEDSKVVVNGKEQSVSKRDASYFNTPCFFPLDIRLAYDIKLYDGLVNMQISGGVKNIFNDFQKNFDLGYSRDADFIYGPTIPRSFFVGLKFSY